MRYRNNWWTPPEVEPQEEVRYLTALPPEYLVTLLGLNKENSMGDGKGAREPDNQKDNSPQADQKAMDPTDDANREPTRPVTPTGEDKEE